MSSYIGLLVLRLNGGADAGLVYCGSLNTSGVATNLLHMLYDKVHLRMVRAVLEYKSLLFVLFRP
uniref:Transcription initiation factor IIA subunit 2 n=1 Tax=Rhizophora mucronata TaxID=61149 RepID=A0A2P2ING1_RHIMU